MSSHDTASTGEPSGTPYNYRIVGILLAIGSGILIGSSFVFKKKGLIASQRGGEAGVGVAYLKSPLWWTGMIMMIVGELCNFGAYAFVEAIIVTPLGALSVVICAMLSSIFLNEKLTFFGWIGCFQCIVGSVIIALNGPKEQSVSTIVEFKHLFLAPGFLSFAGVAIAASVIIVLFVAPKYGTTHMIWYILVCSLIGGLSVSCTQGLGAAIVTSVRGNNQFKNWFTYFLLGFVAITLLTEIYFLNVALALFNTAMVTPTYYVIFTFCTLVTSVILYQGLKSTVTQILTVVLGFLVICSGITLLQMSKVDPAKLQKEHNLDRKSMLLLKVANEEVEKPAGRDETTAELVREEEPGVDALRGFNGLSGTLARNRRRDTILNDGEPVRSIYIPGLGRQSSMPRRTTIGSTSTFGSPLSSPPQPSNGSLHPPGHRLSKSNTAPQLGGNKSNGSLQPPPSPQSSHRPLTSFWQRRTGSGPRKTKINSTDSTLPPATPGESILMTPSTPLHERFKRMRSGSATGPPTDGRSLAGESVPEEPETSELGVRKPRQSEETEPSMRRLLALQEAEEESKGKNIPHIRFQDESEDSTARPAGRPISEHPPIPSVLVQQFTTSPEDGASPATASDSHPTPDSQPRPEVSESPVEETRPGYFDLSSPVSQRPTIPSEIPTLPDEDFRHSDLQPNAALDPLDSQDSRSSMTLRPEQPRHD
ncbi:hypothetical protein FRC01_014807 [Tulasnella sp. 417]|nr:hypothetical protein FRC01_014807 [Tulasnella sp. 417]